MTGSLLSEAFDGTWRFANEKEADGWNYLHFSNGGRIVQFYNITGEKFDTGKMLVRDIGGNQIRFFPRGGGKGWTRHYRFDEGNLVIIEGSAQYPCSRPETIPEWLRLGIEESGRFFAEHEANWQNG